MAVYAISSTKFQEMFLRRDDTLRPWPWPEEAAILLSFFLNPIDLDVTPLEELAEGFLPLDETRRVLAKLIETGTLIRVDTGDAPKALAAHGTLTGMASAVATIAEDIAAFGDYAVDPE